MADTIPISPAGFSASERRAAPRHILESISYVELGQQNGGVILNLCEGGLAMRAAIPVMDNNIPPVKFHLPQVKDWIEVQARVSWKADGNRTVGVEFVNLPEIARQQIHAWIAGQELPAGSAPAIEEPPAPRIAEKLRIPTSLYAPMQPRFSERPKAPVVTMPSPGGAASVTQMPAHTVAPGNGSSGTNGSSAANGAGAANAGVPGIRTVAPDASAAAQSPPTPTNGAGQGIAGPTLVSSAAAQPVAQPGGQSAGGQIKDAQPAASAIALRSAVVGAGALAPTEKRAATIVSPTHPLPSQRSPWILVPMVVILSVAFVLAGWAVGRGGFGALRDMFSGAASSPSSGNELDPSATAAPDAANQIEIADADGRTRTIPWQGPIETPVTPKTSQTARRQGATSATSRTGSAHPVSTSTPETSDAGSAQQNHDVSKIWSVPKQPASSAAGESAESETPPNVDVNSSNASGSLPSAVNSARIQPPAAPIASSRTTSGAAANGTAARSSLPTEGGPIIKRVEPIYPQYAIDSRIEGIVELQALIATDGRVRDVRVLGGPKALVGAAVTAVKQWRFEPAVADGKLVESRQNIRLSFKLGN